MKKAIPLASLLLLAAIGAYLVPRFFAQAPNPPRTTKVAVVNVRAVFKENLRAKALQAELEETLKPYKLQAEKLAKEIDALPRGGDKDTFVANAAALQKKKDEWAVVNTQIIALVEAKHQEKLPTVWDEINRQTKAVAEAYGFQIVLGYGDPDDPDLKMFQGVKGSKLRMADMGCMPVVYIHGSVDITPVLIQMQKK